MPGPDRAGRKGERMGKKKWLMSALAFLTAAGLSVCPVSAAGPGGRTGLMLPGMPSESGAVQMPQEDGEEDGLRSTDAAVTVTQRHTETIVPDKASVTVGVLTDASDAFDAQEENRAQVQAVAKSLQNLGVDQNSIQTSGYSITPSYNDDGTKVTGYQVTASLTVSDLSIAQAGIVLTEAVKAGANTVDGVRFTCSNYDETYQDALQQAVKEARIKAEAMAEAAGETLGGIVSVTEGYQNDAARYNGYSYPMTEASLDKASGTIDFQPGELDVSAEVTAVYALK